MPTPQLKSVRGLLTVTILVFKLNDSISGNTRNFEHTVRISEILQISSTTTLNRGRIHTHCQLQVLPFTRLDPLCFSIHIEEREDLSHYTPATWKTKTDRLFPKILSLRPIGTH